MVEKQAWDTSILPTLNGKGGISCVISSADEFYTFFQKICEDNISKEKSDGIKRHFQGDVEKMARERPEYALAVARAKEQLGESSIAYRTQYKCEFIGKKKQGFFNFSMLKEMNIFQNPFNSSYFKRNRRFVMVAGWDYAPLSDNSMFMIKAIEEGYGRFRKSHYVKQQTLNPNKDIQLDSIRQQVIRAVDLIVEYNIQALILDAGGAGANLKNLLVEEIMNREDVEIDISKIIEVKFSQQNRIDILDNYSNRLNSGYEILFKLPELARDDIELKKYYNSLYNVFEPDAEMIRFIYEHQKFTRTEETMLDGKIKVIYKQPNQHKLHDDTIFASALASHGLTLFPEISYIESTNIGFANYYDNSSVSYY